MNNKEMEMKAREHDMTASDAEGAEEVVQKIRSQYVEKENTELDELRELDAKVKRPANIFAYLFGSVSAIIMGIGMSLIMTDFGKILGVYENMALYIGIPVGVAGIVLVCFAYPVYNRVVKKERERIAPEILQLTEELMK